MATNMSGESSETAVEDLHLDDRHRVLASERRRMVLDILEGNEGPVELEELARGVAAREDGIESVDHETVSRVGLSLHHQHLPIIAETGVFEYDPEATRIRRR